MSFIGNWMRDNEFMKPDIKDDDSAIPTGWMNDIREVEQMKNKLAMIPILGTPEQKSILLEALAASISDRIERNS